MLAVLAQYPQRVSSFELPDMLPCSMLHAGPWYGSSDSIGHVSGASGLKLLRLPASLSLQRLLVRVLTKHDCHQDEFQDLNPLRLDHFLFLTRKTLSSITHNNWKVSLPRSCWTCMLPSTRFSRFGFFYPWVSEQYLLPISQVDSKQI